MKRRTADSRLNLSSNELHHPWIEPLLAAAVALLDPATLARYPVTAGHIATLSGHFGLPEDGMMLTPGSDSAIRLVIAHHAARPDAGELLLQYPNYPAWEHAAAQRGITVRRIGGDAAVQADRLCAAARGCRNALIAVSVPNGPCGWSLPGDRIDELAAIAADQDHLLVVDSCYQAFAGDLTAQLRRAGGPVLVVQSLSKSHGLAGARIGLLTGEPALVAELARGQLEQTVSGPTVGIAVALLAHTARLREIWADIAGVRDRTAAALADTGFTTLPSDGNFLAVDVGSPVLARALVDGMSRRGYRLRDLSDVGGLAGHVRFTICDAATTAAALAALRSVLAAPVAARSLEALP
ncbi:aminotransferase class I/II-fold pyridoxal phosphate-dependent enzyme [Actinophytocola glycyrrhizae]|uniref:Aminotransferase n=1 Tax=Actinophytocola glycyrrhizae TaxID=2044873 RepID=A0ABV9S5J3_9PSEU